MKQADCIDDSGADWELVAGSQVVWKTIHKVNFKSEDIKEGS